MSTHQDSINLNKFISSTGICSRREADKMIAQAQSAIEAERKSAIADLKNQVASLSVEIAEKVVKNELSDKDKQLGLVEEMLGQATLN